MVVADELLHAFVGVSHLDITTELCNELNTGAAGIGG